MRPTRSVLVASCVLLGLLLAVAVAPVRAEDEGQYELNAVVLCEAWRVTSPRVLGEIEAITERRPGASDQVRALLLDGGGERLARLLTPATDGKEVQLSDLRKVPVATKSTSPGGAVTTGFTSFQETGALLHLLHRADDDGTYELELELKVMGAGKSAGDGTPRSQTSTHIETSFVARYGDLRMFLSRGAEDDAIVVFVRASGMQESPGAVPAVDPRGAVRDGFSDAEIERFTALRRLVDERERRRRTEEMITRQLDRLEVELTPEQRAAVVEMTIAYRDTVRERMRSAPRGDREAMQAVLEQLRQDYADALGTVIDAEKAAKIVEGTGRMGGGGFGRVR